VLVGSRGVGVWCGFLLVLVLQIIGSSTIVATKKNIASIRLVRVNGNLCWFYLRRSGDGSLSTTAGINCQLFPPRPGIGFTLFFLYILSLRETVGLTSSIIMVMSLTISMNIPCSLRISTRYCLAPYGRRAKFGEAIGRIEGGGLTPGLLAGLYIDFGYFSIIAFFLIGALLAFTYRKSRRNPYSCQFLLFCLPNFPFISSWLP